MLGFLLLGLFGGYIIQGFGVWGNIIPVMENEVQKGIQHATETVVTWGL